MSEHLLELEGVDLGYGGEPVLRGVDLVVATGDFLGILGPNGAGKTTLFRGLLGLVPPLAGRVHRAPVPIGYVPQRESLDAIFPVTVEEVVHMGAYGRLRGLRRLGREERELARRCLQRVGLVERARQPFSALSGGQRQRALIARALMEQPRLLLLDEPTSGVDRDAEQRILDLLRELHADGGLAVLLVSHDLALVRSVVDEVLWVADGRVRRGTPGEILRPEVLGGRLLGGGAAAEVGA